MNSSAESKIEVYVTDKMLKEFSYLINKQEIKASCGIILKEFLDNLDLKSVNDNYMKEKAIVYFIEGPAWRHDDFLLERSWLSGFAAGCCMAGKNLTLRFSIDQHCVSKLHTPLTKDEE